MTYITETMFIPGKIENWVIVLNLNKMGISSLPINAMKEIMGFLSSNFRSRLFVMYVINAPGAIVIPWNMAKSFLEENTVKKINISKSSDLKKLFLHSNLSQIEKHNGGKADNVVDYWPPIVPSSEFLTENDFLQGIQHENHEVYLLHNPATIFSNNDFKNRTCRRDGT